MDYKDVKQTLQEHVPKETGVASNFGRNESDGATLSQIGDGKTGFTASNVKQV